MGKASRAVSCLCCPCRCLACGLFSCLCSLLISLLVTVGVLALILYLIFRPHMITATVDSASLTQFSLAPNSALTYNLTVAMTVRNPNKRIGQQPLQGDVTAANFRSQQSDGKFSVDVKLNAELRVKVWAFKVRGPKTKISCPLSIPAPGNASATFQPTTCKVWF